MTRIVLLLAVALALAAAASGAQAAVPRIVIVSGKPLPKQVVISDWNDIARIVVEIVPVRPIRQIQVSARPRLKVSLFWGPRWNEYLANGGSAAALRPSQADQQGTFWPRWRERSALLALPWAGGWPRRVPPRALALLKRYGVPTSVD